MNLFRIFPEICANSSCPFDSFTLNIVPANTAEIVPSASCDLLSPDPSRRRRLPSAIAFLSTLLYRAFRALVRFSLPINNLICLSLKSKVDASLTHFS